MTSEFCPSCGNPRVGAFQFCRSCGYDFEALEPTASGPNFHQAADTTRTSSPMVAPAPSGTSPTTPAAATANLPLIGGLAWIACAALIGYLAYQQWVVGRAFGAEDFTANAVWNLVSAAITLYFGVRLLREPSRETLKRSAYWAVITVLWGGYQVVALDVTSDIFVLSLIAAAVAGVVSWVARNRAAVVDLADASEAAATASPVTAAGVTVMPPKAGGRFGVAEIVILIFIVLAIGGGALLLAKQSSDKILADVASLIPKGAPATIAPADGSMIVGLDEVMELVDVDGNDLGTIQVLDSDAPGELLGSGAGSGNRYVAALVQYDAAASWTYTLFDWAVHDSRQRQYEPLGYGPEPTLSGGTIAPGKNVEGWVAFEVPASEEVWLDLQAADGTIIFSVRLP